MLNIKGLLAQIQKSVNELSPKQEVRLIQFSAEQMWEVYVLGAISDGGIEATVSQEEYQSIGERIWVEKGPFWYPSM